MTPDELEVEFVRGEAQRLEIETRGFIDTIKSSYADLEKQGKASVATERLYRRRVAVAEQFAEMCADIAPKGGWPA